MIKLLTLFMLLGTLPAFAQTGDPNVDEDAAKIRSSYISRDQITQGAIEKSSGVFDDAMKSISDSVAEIKEAATPALNNLKDAVAPAINSAADTLGIDVKIQTEAEKAAAAAPVIEKPKDATDIALEEINIKSEIALKMNKSLVPASEELAKAVWEAIPGNFPALKESAKFDIDTKANVFTITAEYADKNNSYNLTIHRDLNFSVVNTVFFNHLFFTPNSPLGLRGLAGEEYYSKDCREGVINGSVAMVCYNNGSFHTYITMAISPSVWFGMTVGGKESLKKAREFITTLNPPKIAIIAKDTKNTNLDYAEEINNIYFSEYKNIAKEEKPAETSAVVSEKETTEVKTEVISVPVKAEDKAEDTSKISPAAVTENVPVSSDTAVKTVDVEKVENK